MDLVNLAPIWKAILIIYTGHRDLLWFMWSPSYSNIVSCHYYPFLNKLLLNFHSFSLTTEMLPFMILEIKNLEKIHHLENFMNF